MAVTLSLLDLAPVAEGQSSAVALRNSLDLVQHAERLGYHRYWVAEHHNMPSIASSSPPVLIAHLAERTSTIRVGAGGVMLPNHAPLIVAEQFGTLEALHPGRIDLGLGRAPGTDPGTMRAIRGPLAAFATEDFPEQLGELIGYFTGEFSADHPSARIEAVPARGHLPSIWLLGSSGYSAQLAGFLGLPFAFAHHFSAHNTLPAIDLYRRSFQPSASLAEPYTMVCTAVVIADDDERARYLAGPLRLSALRLRTGHPSALPTPAAAASHPWTAQQLAIVDQFVAGHIVGGPETVRDELAALLAATAADELMVTTVTYDHADRVRSYERLPGLLPG